MEERLQHVVHELSKWGSEKLDMLPQKEALLERELVGLYQLYCDMTERGVSPVSYPEIPTPQYGTVRLKVAYNFPQLSGYEVADGAAHKLAIEDALEQLSDIVAEMQSIHWLHQQKRDVDALRYFTFIFENRLRRKILPLLVYLNTPGTPMVKAS